MVTYSLLYLACGVFVFLVWMMRAAAIPKDREHEYIGDFGPPYMVNDREDMIQYAWLAVPFWPIHVLVFVLDLLVGTCVRFTSWLVAKLEAK